MHTMTKFDVVIRLSNDLCLSISEFCLIEFKKKIYKLQEYTSTYNNVYLLR